MSSRERPRCGKLMPKAGKYCGLVKDHTRPCMTPEAVRRLYDRAIAFHEQQRVKRYEKINAIKTERGCIDCGYNENPVALDFDHQDRELKVMNVAAMLTYSWAKIQAELEKCVVRCSNCHRIKTHLMHDTRRRPASSILDDAGDGPCDEINDHPPG